MAPTQRIRPGTLEGEHKLLRALVDALPDLMYAKDGESRFVLANQAQASLLGLRPDDLLGKCDHDLFPTEQADGYREDEMEVLATGKPILHREEACTDPRGNTRWLLTSKLPILDDDGHPIGIMGVGRDITELKKARIELERTAEQLAAARDLALASAKAKATFLANMSHEIRTPMNGVIGLTELLLDGDLTAVQRESLLSIAACGQSLVSIINDILDFSKIEAGRLTLERIPFDPTALVEDVVRLYRTMAGAKGIQLSIVTRGDPHTRCLGDSMRLRQVLSNLLSNAVKFTQEGTVTVELDVRRRSEDAVGLIFTVRDTGIGIPRKHLDHIFEAFSQVDVSTTRNFGGTGLGLAICKQLIEMMNGTLTVESEPGQGTRFKAAVRLEAASPLGPESRVSSGPAVPTLPAGLRIVVAEDNEVNAKIAVRMLERLGCSVVLATNGWEALTAMESRPDAVFMDCHMPDLDGYEATRRIRQGEEPGAHVPIIALTACAGNESRDKCLAAGMDDHLAKPFTSEQLASALSALLS